MKTAEQCAFDVGGISDHAQRLICVAGEDYLVENLGRAFARKYFHTAILARDACNADSFCEWKAAAKAVHAAEKAKALSFFPVGVDGADFEVLRQLSPRQPIKLRGLAFRELFQWLSNSLSSVSKSRVGDVLKLPPPDTTPKGWAEIA